MIDVVLHSCLSNRFNFNFKMRKNEILWLGFFPRTIFLKLVRQNLLKKYQQKEKQFIAIARPTVGWNCMKLTHSILRQKPLSHELGSEWMGERANERMSAAERVSEASSAEKVNECAVRVNKRADEWMVQYSMRLFHSHSTVIQDTLKIGQKYSVVPRARERVSKRASEQTQRRASEASSVEQASEWAVRANEWADERVAHY